MLPWMAAILYSGNINTGGRTMNDAVKARIDAELSAIESKYKVRVLMAIESGSRAWGFASRDSDYDVRFL